MNGYKQEKGAHFTNMDWVRYILCTCVYLSHYFALNGKHSFLPIEMFNVGFFALSGFLAYRTYSKAKTTGAYLRRRFCKLMTPYFFVIIFFAIFLGGISSLSIIDYFSSFHFWKYLFFNLITLNFVCPDLPGVFDSDIFVFHAVNGTLWTMKVELFLFFTFPLFMWLHKRFTKHTSLILCLIISISLIYRIYMSYLYGITGNRMYDILGRQFFGEFCFYYMGVFTFLFINKLNNYRWIIFTILISLLIIKYIFWNFPSSSAILISSFSLWFSVLLPEIKYFVIKKNISYMIYLCHCPLLQLSVYFRIEEKMPVLICFIVVTLSVIAMSYYLYKLNNKVTKLGMLQCLYR